MNARHCVADKPETTWNFLNLEKMVARSYVVYSETKGLCTLLITLCSILWASLFTVVLLV